MNSGAYAFVIYGAASDIVSPLYAAFPESHFICLVRSQVPKACHGCVIQTGSESYLKTLGDALANSEKSRTLIYLNAATYQVDKLLISLNDKEIADMLHVGIGMHVAITQKVVSAMVSRRRGRLINISSFRAKSPAKGTSVYSAIKAFNNAFYKSIALEYGRFDITSNSILIGFAESKLLNRLSEDARESFRKAIAKQSFLPPAEFVKCVSYLIDASYLNGAEIELDGGIKVAES